MHSYITKFGQIIFNIYSITDYMYKDEIILSSSSLIKPLNFFRKFSFKKNTKKKQ